MGKHTNLSGMQHTTHVCKIACAGGFKCNTMPFPSRPVHVEISLLLMLLYTQYFNFLKNNGVYYKISLLSSCC